MSSLSNSSDDGNVGNEVKSKPPRPTEIVCSVSPAGSFSPHGDPVHGDIFVQNLMRNDLREWTARYFQAVYKRDVRTTDGKMNFCQDWNDTTWTGDSLILDAMLPFLIEVCAAEYYGDDVVKGADFLWRKVALVHQCLKEKDYEGASCSLADGQCL
jgi:hypothetical protein